MPESHPYAQTSKPQNLLPYNDSPSDPATKIKSNPLGSTHSDSNSKMLPSSPPPSETKIFPETTVILMGDRTVELIDMARCTPAGEKPQKIAAREMTVSGLTKWLRMQTPRPNVLQATFHVGMNDCSENRVSSKQWRELVIQCQRVFPRAELQASSIIPAQGRSLLNNTIRPSNDNLAEVCMGFRVNFKNNNNLFTSKSGAPKKAMYFGKTTIPSRFGMAQLLTNLFSHKRDCLLPHATNRVSTSSFSLSQVNFPSLPVVRTHNTPRPNNLPEENSTRDASNSQSSSSSMTTTSPRNDHITPGRPRPNIQPVENSMRDASNSQPSSSSMTTTSSRNDHITPGRKDPNHTPDDIPDTVQVHTGGTCQACPSEARTRQSMSCAEHQRHHSGPPHLHTHSLHYSPPSLHTQNYPYFPPSPTPSPPHPHLASLHQPPWYPWPPFSQYFPLPWTFPHGRHTG